MLIKSVMLSLLFQMFLKSNLDIWNETEQPVCMRHGFRIATKSMNCGGCGALRGCEISFVRSHLPPLITPSCVGHMTVIVQIMIYFPSLSLSLFPHLNRDVKPIHLYLYESRLLPTRACLHSILDWKAGTTTW